MADILEQSFSTMSISARLETSLVISNHSSEESSVFSSDSESCAQVSNNQQSTETSPVSKEIEFLFEDFDDDELNLPPLFLSKANKENNGKPATPFNLAEYLRSVDEQCGVADITQKKKKLVKKKKSIVDTEKPAVLKPINNDKDKDLDIDDEFLSTREKIELLPITDPRLEELDPNPDIHLLFAAFDTKFFEGLLTEKGVQLKWAKNLTSTAGAYYRQKKTIKLSERLIQQRPRSDLVNTLLHEMIHAFVHQKQLPGRSHGHHFTAIMNRINKAAGTDITVFHSWRAEVKALKKFHWRCTGDICQAYGPTRGTISLPTQRKPNRFDHSVRFHEKYNCTGTFQQISDNFTTPNQI